jgi:hypothetical protein
MQVLTADFETYFSDDYTLKRLTTEAYIRDPRFQALMLGVRYPNGAKDWVPRERIPAFCASVDWENTALLGHHQHFDGLIFSHHYGVKPRMWFDTLSMGRLVHGNHLSLGLESLAKHYGLEPKSVPYQLFKGKRWENIDEALRNQLGAGAVHDCELTWQIFKEMAKDFPQEEYLTIDMTIRMFTEPQFEGDAPLFDQVVQAEQVRKHNIMQQVGATEADLQSAGKFVKLLEELGIEVETKTGKNGPIPAIASTDDFMKDLVADLDPVISTLAQARLDVKSTIAETRAARLADMARRGPMPVYLAYGAAHTLRWGGGDKVNWQNLPRLDRVEGKIVDPLQMRLGVRAPPGHLIAVVDKSQIEVRLLCKVAGQHDDLQAFHDKRDVYIEQATKTYGRPITKADTKERGMAKQLILSGGYGASWRTTQKTAKRGTYGPVVFLSDEEAQRLNRSYRDVHKPITDLWKEGDMILGHLARKETIIWRDVVEIRNGRIYGPNGSYMIYHLEWDDENRQWMRRTRRGSKKIWGGHLVENLIQYLARIDMMQSMHRIWNTTGYRAAGSVHDEGLWVIPDDQHAEATLEVFLAEMRRCPTWLPGTPLDAEGALAVRYEK